MSLSKRLMTRGRTKSPQVHHPLHHANSSADSLLHRAAKHTLRTSLSFENLKLGGATAAGFRMFGDRPNMTKIIDNLTEYFPMVRLVEDGEEEDGVAGGDAAVVVMNRNTVKLLRAHTAVEDKGVSRAVTSFGRKTTKVAVPGVVDKSKSWFGQPDRVVLFDPEDEDEEDDGGISLKVDCVELDEPGGDAVSILSPAKRQLSSAWKRKLTHLGNAGGLFISVDAKPEGMATDSPVSNLELRQHIDESLLRNAGQDSGVGDVDHHADSLLPPLMSQRARGRTFNGFVPRPCCDSPTGEVDDDCVIPDLSISANLPVESPTVDVALTSAETVSMTMENLTTIEHDHLPWTRGKLIGQGSFGKVFFGVNLATQEVMAVKQVQLVPLKHGAMPALVNRNKKLLDALNIEISLLRELNHENIVNYLGFDVKENLVSVFLEYIDGGSLASILSKYGKCEFEMAQSFTCQILSGLEYLHDRCIIHRDIKGANILVNHNGVVKIADFGISKKNEYKYQPNARLSLQGTIYWMAPEVMENQGGYSAKVDIWSLGCVAYEMLEGHHPWTGLNEMQIMWKVGRERSAPDLKSAKREDVKEFFRLCFEMEPEKRPTATQLLAHSFGDVDPLDFDFQAWLVRAEDGLRRSAMKAESSDESDSSSDSE
ncbi:hypothetical protein HDU98_000300 [Podochytrium sp. JEL0797]|nr:hypothetical protein HDU98_000300 [Podochytrium sp. JEL0797]